VPIDFLFQIENTKSEFLYFPIFKYKLKIENQPFFSDFRFFSFLFVTENVTLTINFFNTLAREQREKEGKNKKSTPWGGRIGRVPPTRKPLLCLMF